MRKEIVVAVVDQGVNYDKIRPSVKSNLYWNHRETADNGRDDDGNGFVDDITGPTSGPASNGYYQIQSGNHGMGMVADVSRQIDEAERIIDASLPVSIMPVSMYGPYYANIVAAAEAGASVINLSHNLSNSQKEYVSSLLRPYDVIAVTVDRDRPGGERYDAGDNQTTAYDNVLEVALVSDALVKGNVYVDLLEVGSSLKNTSESHAIANAAGKIAAIWAIDPSRSAPDIVDVIRSSTRDDHPTIQAQGLSSTMGGQIDLLRGIEISTRLPSRVYKDGENGGADVPHKDIGLDETTEEPSLVVARTSITASGYTRGSAADEAFVVYDKQSNMIGGGGDDAFVFHAFASRKHVIRDFNEGDILDLSALTEHSISPEERVRFIEASWNGETHTKVMVEKTSGDFGHLITLVRTHDLEIEEMVASQTLIL